MGGVGKGEGDAHRSYENPEAQSFSSPVTETWLFLLLLFLGGIGETKRIEEGRVV